MTDDRVISSFIRITSAEENNKHLDNVGQLLGFCFKFPENITAEIEKAEGILPARKKYNIV